MHADKIFVIIVQTFTDLNYIHCFIWEVSFSKFSYYHTYICVCVILSYVEPKIVIAQLGYLKKKRGFSDLLHRSRGQRNKTQKNVVA